MSSKNRTVTKLILSFPSYWKVIFHDKLLGICFIDLFTNVNLVLCYGSSSLTLTWHSENAYMPLQQLFAFIYFVYIMGYLNWYNICGCWVVLIEFYKSECISVFYPNIVFEFSLIYIGAVLFDASKFKLYMSWQIDWLS